MTPAVIRRELKTESDANRLAAELAAIVRPGDLIALTGPLGAGKTTLARALIRVLCANPHEDVPSPTFTLVQTYEHARLPVWHFDLYRIERADEVFELGFEEAESQGLSLVEWPERMEDYLPGERLDICIDDEGGAESRHAVLSGHEGWTPRLARMEALQQFLAAQGWGSAARRWLQGDASTRSYERLTRGGHQVLLMNAPPMPDGPPIRNGLSYSRIAHLAEDMRAFVAVAGFLRGAGLSAPEVLAHELAAGFLLIEDLGDEVYGGRIEAGTPMDAPYDAALDVLLALRERPVPTELPVEGGAPYTVPAYDRPAMMIELDLLAEWFWPHVKGGPMPGETRAAYEAAWQAALDGLTGAQTLVLRDYHSPNLLWLPERAGAARAGLIDFQDAVLGPPAYDLASLLQDARVDVPPTREEALRALYMARAGFGPGEAQAFAADYALMGAQRACKILGIFVRLLRRDGKPGYLRHIPRVSGYLERNLQHPALKGVQAWFARYLPEAERIN